MLDCTRLYNTMQQQPSQDQQPEQGFRFRPEVTLYPDQVEDLRQQTPWWAPVARALYSPEPGNWIYRNAPEPIKDVLDWVERPRFPWDR